MVSPAAVSAVASATKTIVTKAAPSTSAPTGASTTAIKSLQGPLFARVQHGLGRIVAQAVDSNNRATTRLTNLSHQAPFRWIPLRSSAVAQRGAAVVYGSNYGGGLLPGDVYETALHVKSHAKLGLLTQGSNRVYKRFHRADAATSNRPSRIQTRYQVDAHGLLVVAPDPLTPFADSSLEQTQKVRLDPNGNLCWIDWVAAGRLSQGERWQQASLSSRTEFYLTHKDDDDENNDNDDDNKAEKPFLVDAVHMDHSMNSATFMDWSSSTNSGHPFQFNAYATLVLYGKQVRAVMEACQGIQSILSSQWTSTRDLETTRNSNDGDHDTTTTTFEQDATPTAWTTLPTRLTGPVFMGVTRIDTPPHKNQQSDQHEGDMTMMVVRLAAVANEDLYRVFHACLAPLTTSFGHSFYQERIRAVYSAPVPTWTRKEKDSPLESSHTPSEKPPPSLPATSPRAQWAAHLLTDSALPTGGFAHSAGLEAAAQLKLVQSPQDIEQFAHATVASTLQLVSPTIEQIHDAVSNKNNKNNINQRWKDIHDDLEALLIANGSAYRASIDQGTSLLRLARQWPSEQPFPLDRTVTQGHYAAVFALQTANWGLSVAETRHLLAFCVARDVISAAVRLNLIGPLASVPMLARAHQAVVDIDEYTSPAIPASSCAPVLEALQPIHDVLAVRLFRT